MNMIGIIIIEGVIKILTEEVHNMMVKISCPGTCTNNYIIII